MSEKELPRKMKFDPLHASALLWKNREKVPAIVGTMREIVADGKNDKPRSLRKDLHQFNELFGTEVQIKGTENIPQTGGLVLVTSHIVSTEKAPGWLNKDANPFWWLSSIAGGVASVRDDEIRPIVYTRSNSGSLHRKILEGLYGGFPVSHKNKHKELNRNALRNARQGVEKGEIVLIAPEGENRVALSKAHYGGMSKLVAEGTTFVPVTYYETEVKEGEYTYTVEFGKPVACDFSIQQSASETDKEKVTAFVDHIMTEIASLLPEEKRGYYSNML